MKVSEFRKLIREEINKTVNEVGNTSNVHPWVLSAMEELRDDLDFYLGPKNSHAGSSVDFDLLKKKMADLLKKIKQYHP